MIKIAIVTINKNPVSKIPGSLISSMRKKLPENWELVIISETNQLMKGLMDVDYIISYPIPRTYIKRNKKLKGIFFLSSQVNDSFKEQNYKVWDIKGLNSQFVANHAMSFSKKAELDSTETVIGIIGMGKIGQLIAKDHIEVGYTVQYFSRSKKPEVDYPFYEKDNLKEFLKSSDVIIISTSLNSETQKLFTKEVFFDFLKTNTKIINIARGELFIEIELVEFLTNNPNSFYYTDVVYPEPYPQEGALRNLSNILITDHVAGFDEKLWPKIEDKLSGLIQTWSQDEK